MILIYLIFLINIKLYFSLEFIKDSDLKKKKYEESNIKLKQPYTEDSEVKYLKPSEDHRTSDLSNKKLYQFKIEIENTNKNGLIYRARVANPIPYMKDSDYFVLLSDSEAMPYCIMESIAVNTKVIVTPLEAYDELGIVNGKNGFIIPFNYFEEKNRKKLVALVKKIYKEKDKAVKFKLKESLWDGYNDIFIK